MSTSKVPLSVPFPQVIFSDAQYTILPDVSSYKLHDKNTYKNFLLACNNCLLNFWMNELIDWKMYFSPLDESHMKVGVRSLARLHALSYAYFNRLAASASSPARGN